MWRGIIALYLLVRLKTVLSSPPSPVNVIFSSVNLRNVLHWHAGNGCPPDTHYTVQYAIYGDRAERSRGRRVRWRAVQHCRDMGRSLCDLTNETSDLEEGYFARVRAGSRKGWSRWTETQRRFDPYTDTSFGPPSVSMVMVDVNSAVIRLKGPMRWRQDNHTPDVSMATLYGRQMTYNLWVHNTRRNHTHQVILESGQSEYKYQLLDYDTEFCFSASASFLVLPILCQRSAWHCLTTTQDPAIGQLQRVVVGIVVASLCACVLLVAGYLLYRSLRGTGDKMPDILLTPLHMAPQTFSPDDLDLIFIPATTLSHPKPQQPISALPDLLEVGFRPGYAPQRHLEPDAPWENEFLEAEEVVYGFVKAATVIIEGGEEGEIEERREREREERREGEREERREGEREERREGEREERKEGEREDRREGEREERNLDEREGKMGGREGLETKEGERKDDGEREGRREGEREECERRGEREIGARECTSQANPYIPQKMSQTHTHTLSHTPTHTATRTQTHTQTSAPQTVANKDTNSEMEGEMERESEGEMERRIDEEIEKRIGKVGKQTEGEMEDYVCQGAFIERDLRTGLFNLPLLTLPHIVGQRKGEEERGMRRQTKRGLERGMKRREERETEREEEASLSPYAPQHSKDTPTSDADQWNYSSDDYGVLGVEQEEEEEEEEEEAQINCVNWNPVNGILVFPEIKMEREREGAQSGWMEGEREWEREIGGEKRERECRLESVLVRQTSEEERETESREHGWMQTESLLSTWGLMINMDQ